MPLRRRTANQRGAEVVLGAACRAGTEVIVHVSSAAVFSLTDGAPITETTPLTRAAGGYAASKVAVEQFVRGMQAAGAPVTLLYPVGIYGGIPTELDQTHEALAYWVNDATLDTSSGINVVDVRDVAEAAVRCVEQKVVGERLDAVRADYLPWTDMGGFLDDLVQGDVPRVRIPGAVLRGLGRLVDAVPAIGRPVAFPLTHEAMTYATQNLVTDGTHATDVLGLEYRPVRTTMRDALGGWPARATSTRTGPAWAERVQRGWGRRPTDLVRSAHGNRHSRSAPSSGCIRQRRREPSLRSGSCTTHPRDETTTCRHCEGLSQGKAERCHFCGRWLLKVAELVS